MGQVFLAEHTVLGRRAAVKVLHPELSREGEALARFFNEARASASLHHPGLIDVYDFGQNDAGQVFIVMELLEGLGLRDLLTRHKVIPPVLAIDVARQIAEAMAVAHEHGIIHRDLKPENLFLVPDREMPQGWRAKVLDFGIAKLYGEGQKSVITTRTGNILGTPTYMAPEQCHGASHVDLRCDIYSLGCILFEMLCGQPPFPGEGVGAVIAAHMFEAPPLPSSLMPDLPVEVDAAIMGLLTKEPDHRVQTMVDVATLLGELPIQDLRSPHELTGWSTTLASGTSQTPIPSVSGTPPRASRTPRGSVPPPSRSRPMPRVSARQQAIVGSAATVRTPGAMPAVDMPSIEIVREPNNTLDAAVASLVPGAVPKKRRRGVTLGGLALATFLVAGGSAWYLLRRSERADLPGATPPPTASLLAPIPIPVPVAVPAPAEEPAPTPASEAAPVTQVSVRVQTEPTGALVTREIDGVVLGRTPLELHLDRGNGHLAVSLEKPGYRTSRAELPLDRDGNALVEMVPKNARATRPGKKPTGGTTSPASPSPSPSPAAPSPAAPVKDGTLDPYGN
jgi:serine/threonine protein kinase